MSGYNSNSSEMSSDGGAEGSAASSSKSEAFVHLRCLLRGILWQTYENVEGTL